MMNVNQFLRLTSQSISESNCKMCGNAILNEVYSLFTLKILYAKCSIQRYNVPVFDIFFQCYPFSFYSIISKRLKSVLFADELILVC